MTFTRRATRRTSGDVLAATGVLLASTLVALVPGTLAPAHADISYSQEVVAVGTLKKTWTKQFTNYGPGVYYTFCGGRTGCTTAFQYWRVARGTVHARLTTYKVKERIKAYDYYVLDYDVVIDNHSGSARGGAGKFRIHSYGPSVLERNESKGIGADKSACTTLGVDMSTPWPVLSASTNVGNVRFCDEKAKLSRGFDGSDVRYSANLLGATNHLTMQRWVKVRQGKHPSFKARINVPTDVCTKGDGKGHCVDFDNHTAGAVFDIGTTGALGTTTAS